MATVPRTEFGLYILLVSNYSGFGDIQNMTNLQRCVTLSYKIHNLFFPLC
jgi:hypothetical protein